MSDAVEPFGFKVRRDEGGRWSVFLPHQCDSWDIAGDSLFGMEGVPHAEAVAELERFLAEGQQALAALRAQKEDWRPA